MAYEDNTASNLGKVTFKGFSSKAKNQNFKVYDFECAKQDLINRLSVRKGERVENPEFGTIIYKKASFFMLGNASNPPLKIISMIFSYA